MNYEIPESWTVTTIDAVVKNTTQRVPDGAEKFLYIDISSINRDKKQIVSPQSLLGKDAPSRARKVVQTGDILVSMTRPNMNAVALVPEHLNDQVASTGFDVLRANEIDTRWLFYLVRTYDFVSAMSDKVQGALYPAISSKVLREYEIPLAPLNEQKRIADKLDILLAAVDACRARLDKVPTFIKRFRQSVLAAATSGQLTADWRQDEVSPGAEFPASWSICTIKEAGKIQLGRQRSPKFHSGENMRPYLRVANVFEDRLNLSDVMEMDFSGQDFERYQLHPGDILLNEGQSPEFLGRPAMYRGEIPGVCFTNTLIRFQSYEHVISKFALVVFRNQMHSGRYLSEGTITTNIAHLGAARFSNIEFPLPPKTEQHEIVRRVEALFAVADKMEASLATARKRVDQLTPSILAQAFRGELVEQDPTDEPACVLLARIAAASTPVAPRRTTRKAA